ncbi:hypothetical protein UE98_29785 [Burkholderia cenocepacia]|nr:hypothetical protein UE98_29785 [Burkholderia cenocepacia]
MPLFDQSIQCLLSGNQAFVLVLQFDTTVARNVLQVTTDDAHSLRTGCPIADLDHHFGGASKCHHQLLAQMHCVSVERPLRKARRLNMP